MIWLLLACQDEVTQVSVECDERITYETVGEPFLRNYCTGCHAAKLEPGDRFGAPASVNLDSYDDAKQWALRSYVRSVHFQTMPPSGGISPEERERFKQWALCGAKGSETVTPTVSVEERGTSRLVFSMVVPYEHGFVIERYIEDDADVAPEDSMTRAEYYAVDEGEVAFEGYEEWDLDGRRVASVQFDPGLPMGPDNWQDAMTVEAQFETTEDSWTETQNWTGYQAYQSLWEVDVHERDPNPLLIHWWNEQGEEWGWRTSRDNVLSSTFGMTVSGLQWESQQFTGPQQLGSEFTFPLQENLTWIDLWLEWQE